MPTATVVRSRGTTGAKRLVTRNLFEAKRALVRVLKGTEAFERAICVALRRTFSTVGAKQKGGIPPTRSHWLDQLRMMSR
jgi:hypothetical protein